MRDRVFLSRRKSVVAALLTPLVLASCGHRLDDAELGLGDGVAVTQDGGAAVGAVGDSGAAPAGTGAGAGTSGAAAPGVTAPQTGGGTAGPSQGSTAGTGNAGGSAVAPGGGKSSTAGGGASASGGSSAPCAKTLDPILLGQNGTFSGFLQGSLQGFRPGLAAWAADVNSRGGVQCHPVKLFQVDDGSNPAKTVSNTKDLIENKKVVAMVAAVVPFNITSYRSVVDPAGIPTIGGDNVDSQWGQDPLIYPTGVTLLPGMALAMKASAERTGLKKFAVVYCVEAAPCAQANQQAKNLAEAAGVQIVNQQSISLTQTDYTSNCQTAKNAGAESVLAVFDSSALQRFFRSCAAIGYYPPSATIGLAVGAAAAADPNVRKSTVTVTPVNAPHFNTFTPGVADFVRVMKRYAPGVELDSSSMSAYTAGRLFEAALAKVASEARSGPVTTAMILKGLNSIKNERLDGLVAAPLTFKAGEPHPAQPCAYITVVLANGIADPSKGKASCLAKNLTANGAQSGAASPHQAPASEAKTYLRPAATATRQGRRVA
ncbi:hypothetical protein GCM10009547_35400 [Sporichthya brevicatena]|uniref:Leucine-binding protein domain-containing protein n=1 Tax=Sporichthya brevicatena TaxID=171442 RepID=A0ABN1H4D2_9ACTN